MPDKIVIPQRMHNQIIYPSFVLILEKPLLHFTYHLPDLGGCIPTLHEDRPDEDEKVPA